MINRHHICPRSKGGSNEQDNIIMLKEKYHNAFHRVFANDDPREQIIRLVCSINISALTDEFRNDILNVLSESDKNYYYKDGILLPKNLIGKKKH